MGRPRKKNTVQKAFADALERIGADVVPEVLTNEGGRVEWEKMPDLIAVHCGDLTKVADALGVTLTDVETRVQEDKDSAEMLKTVTERVVQTAETALMDRIAAGDTKAIIFALKCLKKEKWSDEANLNIRTTMSASDTEKAIKGLFGIK